MQYIPPLVFSSVTLIDPAVTAFISWAAGIENLPGLFSWLGGCVVVSGVAVISYGERQRTSIEDKEQSEASKTSEDDHHRFIVHKHDTLDSVIPSHHNSVHAIDLDDIEPRDPHDNPREMEVEMRRLRVVLPSPEDAV